MISAVQYGVGARFTLSVYGDDYVDVILGALGAADATGLTVETGDVSTFVGGDERRILEYLAQVIGHAASTGRHISAHVLLSRGCPGALQCALPDGVQAVGGDPVELPATGIRARAHWSLYPLLDGGHDGEHMDGIYRAVQFARDNGTYVGSDHFATLLDGDLADVLATVASGWMLVGRDVQHVTSHVTLSINSPTPLP